MTFHADLVTNKVHIFTNIYDDFMTPSVKTKAKDTLRPIIGDISIVPSCIKIQESGKSENCSRGSVL